MKIMKISRKTIRIFLLFLLFITAGCDKSRTQSVTPSSSAAYKPFGEPVNLDGNASNDISAFITGVWKIRLYAKNAGDGSDYDLQSYYGSGLKYGGTLTFYEGGNFTKYVGITTGDHENHEGTYSVRGNEITFKFNGGNIEKAVYLPSIQEIEYYMPNEYGSSFYEYFEKNESK